jgi:hypothetical protein
MGETSFVLFLVESEVEISSDLTTWTLCKTIESVALFTLELIIHANGNLNYETGVRSVAGSGRLVARSHGGPAPYLQTFVLKRAQASKRKWRGISTKQNKRVEEHAKFISQQIMGSLSRLMKRNYSNRNDGPRHKHGLCTRKERRGKRNND